MLRTLRSAASAWYNDRIALDAAAIAYYSVFSLPAFLLIVLAALGMFFERKGAERALFGRIRMTFGPDVASALQAGVDHTVTQDTNIFYTVIGITLLLFAAIGAYGSLRSAMRQIFGARAPRPTWASTAREYLLSFALLIGAVVIIVAEMTASAVIALLGDAVSSWLFVPVFTLGLINVLITLLTLMALFSLLYTVLPGIRLPRGPVLLGAAVTSLLFWIGKWGIERYIAVSTLQTQYGVAASLLILLFWIYYAANVFLFGAAFIRARMQ